MKRMLKTKIYDINDARVILCSSAMIIQDYEQ